MRFSVRRSRGVKGGSPVSSSSVVRRPSSCPAKPESSESPKKAQSRKKMKRPTTAGGCVSPRPTARYPSPRPRPTPPTAKYGIAKNGELLGPKVKAQLALEARGHVPNADDGSAFVRFYRFVTDRRLDKQLTWCEEGESSVSRHQSTPPGRGWDWGSSLISSPCAHISIYIRSR